MPKIVILDDDELNARTTARVLRMNSFEAVTTNTPIGFVELLQREKPDLALVDVKMPEMDGDEVVRITRRQLSDQCCPLVLWSSRAPEELAALVQTSGASGYIHKSAGPTEFIEKVREFLILK